MIWILITIIAIIIIVWIVIYNHLVRLSTEADSSWSQIDVQLKRRNDLIPNLVATVKGYASYEKTTLSRVVQLRGQMVHIDSDQLTSKQQIMQMSNQLSKALKSLFAVSERYPDLKANNDFKELMDELTNTENKIAYARQLYNNVIAQYNASIQKFPNILVAGNRFARREYLKTPGTEKSVPHVNFGNFDR